MSLWYLQEPDILNTNDLNLSIDIGNSSSKVAVFSRNKMVYYRRFQRLAINSLDKIIEEYQITKTIISSTRNLDKNWIQRLKKKTYLVLLNHTTKVTFINLYQTPQTLGRDRIAGIAGALKIYPSQNVLIADLGTCNTYDFIDSKKRYYGGNIAPGLQMRLIAMHNYTDKLPLVKSIYNKTLMGLSTQEAMQNGAIWGIILEIEGYIKALAKEYGTINVILTGGDAPFFANHFKKKIFAEPYLVLIGLNQILKLN